MPERYYSKSINEQEKANEDSEFQIIFEVQLELYVKEKATYEHNMSRASAYLWTNCSPMMQHKIKARSDYETKIRDDGIELLNAIEEHALRYDDGNNDNTRRYHCIANLTDATQNVFTIRQRSNESLYEYAQRFRTISTIMVNQLGGQIPLIRMVETAARENSQSDKSVLQDEAWKGLLAYLFLDRADPTRYGHVVEELRTMCAMGQQNRFPDTLERAIGMLNAQGKNGTYS
ncbi:hypothetical protein IV203_032147 [Nitzschia inconspicua]|uniref:Uncharacterized protein n=1 Tax=Nitzschia inconspicua TaxID=303405 RepID=A0A9K3Q5R3_9STRA|nr:hypothetical protein IV203_032147 [Nitzschia inconspicua]